MNKIPQDLNWVKTRADCSVARIFSLLHQEADEDVKEVNQVKMEMFPGYPGSKFSLNTNSTGSHFVVFEDGNAITAVKFTLMRDHIEIVAEGKQYAITPTLSDEGKCRLRINDGEEQFERWQVRRRMLENLFFGGTRRVMQ